MQTLEEDDSMSSIDLSRNSNEETFRLKNFIKNDPNHKNLISNQNTGIEASKK